MKFEELKEHAQKLVSLLEDPQPGLSTWNEFLVQHFKAIHDGWDPDSHNFLEALETISKHGLGVAGEERLNVISKNKSLIFAGVCALLRVECLYPETTAGQMKNMVYNSSGMVPSENTKEGERR